MVEFIKRRWSCSVSRESPPWEVIRITRILQSGSAYLFQRHVACSYCESVWAQIMKFSPIWDGLDDPTDAAAFGSS